MSEPLRPSEPEPAAAYEARLAEGRISFQRCGPCAGAVFPPRVLCPHCGAFDLTWAESGGHGVIHSTTTVARRDGSTYPVVLVDVEEGWRLMSTVVGDDAVAIGDRVRGSVEPATEKRAARVVFAREEQRNAG